MGPGMHRFMQLRMQLNFTRFALNSLDQISCSRKSTNETNMIFWRHTFLVLLLALSFSGLAFAQGNFSVSGTDYECDGNLICLGDAHIAPAHSTRTLSLVRLGESDAVRSSGGIAYYNKPVRFRNSNGQAASFKTSFSCDQKVENKSDTNIPWYHGDGFTFVISADNSTLGEGGDGFFGFFNKSGTNPFKSVVVEFDSVYQSDPPISDKSANHVSVDLMTIATECTKNADDVQIFFFDETTVYIWVEYEDKTQDLEVRISNFSNRPPTPFLSCTVNISKYVEDYMWVGFSAGHGIGWSFYYIGDWTFESYGVPTEPQTSPTRRKKSSRIAVTVGSIAGVAGFLMLLTCVAFFLVRRRGAAVNGHASGHASLHVSSRFRRLAGDDVMLQMAGMGEGYCFSYEELKAATGGFSEDRKLGQGGFGSVYRGVLPKYNVPIAVKKVKQESEQGEKEFKAEVSVISQLRHRHLIQLLGWCIKGGKYHIVYELMPNGSLDKFLFGPAVGHDVLAWPLRRSIIEGTAAAVDYLHRGWKQQVIHRDIKASNILLDDKWNAKLGDFGLARVVDHQQIPSTTVVAGTYGYMAPESMASGKFTDKSDVYAFGVVALEMACGRKSIALHVEPDEIILVDWVWRCMMAGDLLRVVDPDLIEYDEAQMEALLLMGLFCSHRDPLARPSMRTVVQVLLGDAPVPPAPTTNPGPVYNDAFRHKLMLEKSKTTFRLSSFSASSPIRSNC